MESLLLIESLGIFLIFLFISKTIKGWIISILYTVSAINVLRLILPELFKESAINNYGPLGAEVLSLIIALLLIIEIFEVFGVWAKDDEFLKL